MSSGVTVDGSGKFDWIKKERFAYILKFEDFKMASASRSEAFNILRTLYRELRPTVNKPQTNVYQTQLWKHIVGLCKNCKTQPKPRIDEVQKNLEATGRLYILYLQSSKEYHRITDIYKGAGERSAQDTAKILGFKMPNEPKDEPRLKDEAISSTVQEGSQLESDTTLGIASKNVSGSSKKASSSSSTAHCSPIA